MPGHRYQAEKLLQDWLKRASVPSTKELGKKLRMGTIVPQSYFGYYKHQSVTGGW